MRELRRCGRGIGVVIYGAGRAFTSSVSYVSDLVPSVEDVYYFGDLDAPGLQIAVAADRASKKAEGARIMPAGLLYNALMRRRLRRPTEPQDPARLSDLVAWLPPDVRTAATELLARGWWLPQEAVGLEVLRGMETWV